MWALGCAGPAPKSAGPAPGRVRPGIEVLLTDSLGLVRDRRVGLVTNQTGVDADGISDVERLRTAGVRLVALFSPEHGFRGAADPGAAIASGVDSATGLPIYSLYGRVSAPTPEMLRGIEVMVVDLQDAGARYYTYLATTVDVMQAAGAAGLRVLVLDRPNPIGGLVQGNVLEREHITNVGRLELPMRHGMTLGELAGLARTDLGLATDLRVVPVSGWSRSQRRGFRSPMSVHASASFIDASRSHSNGVTSWASSRRSRSQAIDQTGLPFVPPSPNLRTVESLFHYPGLCLFEGTNLSVGRGSDAPFEQIGAPWLDTAAVLRAVRAAGLPGVEFAGVG